VFFDPPRVGDQVPAVRRDRVSEGLSELYAPLSGELVQVNLALADGAATVNEDPYGKGWLVKVKPADHGEVGLLLDAHEYVATVKV
jgi:glycine cleavage system H protein